eukprot:GSChrysophyteH1.ASY1.ANO1.1502.1 assembled CDS
MQALLVLFSVLSHLLASTSVLASLSCLGDDGSPVDTWTGIKGNKGYNMYYYAAASQSFVQSPFGVGQTTQGAIMRTLNPLYDSAVNATYAYILYNDEPPDLNAASSTYAHAKGILATDGTSGYWLTHSMPHWPNSPLLHSSPGIFPNDYYGQSMRCVTVSIDTANAIANTLRIDYPFVYAGGIPTDLEASLTHMTQLKTKVKINSANITAANTLYSLAGQEYIQFAKSRHWGMDFWDDLVAPYYKTPMYVETWIRGSGGAMSSMCYNGTNGAVEKINEPYDILEVSEITMPGGQSWPNEDDHSKWGIAADMEPGNNQQFNSEISCVGDMNRMCSQEKRGGGALCISDPGQKKAFREIIAGVEPCYERNPCGANMNECYWCGGIAAGLSYPPTASPTQQLTSASPTLTPGSPTQLPTTASPTQKPTAIPGSPTQQPTTASPTQLPTARPTPTPGSPTQLPTPTSTSTPSPASPSNCTVESKNFFEFLTRTIRESLCELNEQ